MGSHLGISRMFPKNSVFPPNDPFVHRVFHCKPSILGSPYFWKHSVSNSRLEAMNIGHLEGDETVLRGRKRSKWLLTTYKSWDDPTQV